MGLAVDSSKVLPNNRLTKSIWVASLTVSAALLLLPWIFKLDGSAHADWQQFLGRFHPLVVHLPIGLILLVPLLELAGRFRPALREAAAFVLSLSIFACLSAVTLGYLLAYGSGDKGAVVTRHMWGGISLTIAVLLCALARPWWDSGKQSGILRHAYPGLLGCVLLLLGWTAHQGGSLTHGNNYLTEYMPAPLKHWSGIQTAQAKVSTQSGSFYAAHINPILDANCVACHRESKANGGLRVDSYEELMKGGKDGAVISPGHPEKSLLLARVTLPPNHKNFMPAEGKPPLKPEEIAWIEAWIRQGASSDMMSLAGVSVPDGAKDALLPQVGDYSRLMAEIAQTAGSAGVTLVPLSRHPGDGLILNTVDAPTTFNDAQLAKFLKFAPYIVEMELGRTAVTNNCFDTLGKFTHLRVLHLEDTAITGDGLAKLTQLSQLTYLNLSGTKVTDSAIAPLSSMKQLRHLYLYNTPAQPVAATPVVPPTDKKAL